jgi:DNA-directed RNA polymerase specialized sigma24 family protein
MTAKIFNEWVNLYADGVYRFILKNLRHEEDARDIVQGAFEKLWINREQVTEGSVKSYLFTIAYNLMIDRTAKRKGTEANIKRCAGTAAGKMEEPGVTERL